MTVLIGSGFYRLFTALEEKANVSAHPESFVGVVLLTTSLHCSHPSNCQQYFTFTVSNRDVFYAGSCCCLFTKSFLKSVQQGTLNRN